MNRRPPQAVSMSDAFDQMHAWGYEPDQYEGLFEAWHSRGDCVLLFANRDINSYLDRPLGIAIPWDLPLYSDGWPPHAPDTDGGLLGWRYLPAFVVLPPGAGDPVDLDALSGAE